MAVDFKKFDQMIDQNKLKKDMEEAAETSYTEVPAGKYLVLLEKMEIKETKAKDKLMFAASFRIKDTIDAPMKQNNRCIFFNRVISGNKTTEKWNDGRAIKGVITWLEELTDEELEFKNYSKFSDDVLSLFQDVKDTIEVEINYDPEAFNPIEIVDVYDK